MTRLVLAALLILGFASGPAATAGTGFQASAPGDDATRVRDEYARWLDEVDRLRDEGDPEAGRLHLEGLVDSELHVALLAIPVEQAWPLLLRLDTTASSIQSPRARLFAHEGSHDLLLEALGPDDPQVLTAKRIVASSRRDAGDLSGSLEYLDAAYEIQKERLAEDDAERLDLEYELAVTRYRLAEFEGAHALFARIHSVYAGALEPDDRDLLDAKVNLATSLKALGELEEARTLQEAVHEVRARDLPPGDGKLLFTKQNLAVTLFELRDFETALDLQEYVHEWRVRQLGPEHEASLDAKSNLANTLMELGQLERAHALLEFVHGTRAERLPPDHFKRLAAAQNLAVTRSARGDYAGSRVLLEGTLEVLRDLFPPHHPQRLETQQNLAADLYELGELQAALELEEEIHRLRSELHGPDHPLLLAAKQNLARTAGALGDLERAHELHTHVHDVRERDFAPNDPDLLDAQQNLASTLVDLGEFERALELFERVCDVRMRDLPPDHPDRLEAQMNLAAVKCLVDDVEGSLAVLERVHAICERSLPPGNPDRMRVENNLASVRLQLGDVEGARLLLERVHDGRTDLFAPDHPDLLDSKLALAEVLVLTDDAAEAFVLAETVHTVRSETLHPTHPDLLAAKSHLASVHAALGDHEAALALDERVHEAWSAIAEEDHPFLLDAKQNLATSRHGLGDFEGALALHEQVLASRSESMDPGHPLLMSSMQSIGGTLEALGDDEGAAAIAREILAGSAARTRYLAVRSPRFARSAGFSELLWLSRQRDVLRSLGSIEDEAARSLFEGVEHTRILTTGGLDGLDDSPPSQEVADIRRELARVRHALGGLGLGEGTAETAEEVFALAESRDALERQLRLLLARSDSSPPVPSVVNVQEQLESHEALVSFIAFPSGDLTAFVVAPERFETVDLGSIDAIVDLVESWRSALGKPVDKSEEELAVEASTPPDRGTNLASPSRDRSELVHGRALREALLDRCLAAMDDPPRTLLLVLDDALHLVPFAALPGETADERLGDRHTIRYLSSTLPLLAATESEGHEGTLVAIGGVVYDTESVASQNLPLHPVRDLRGSRPQSFAYLPATRSEAEAVAELFDARDPSTDAVVLTGVQATKRRLVELAPDARYLHVATHGYFASEFFLSEREALRQGGAGTRSGTHLQLRGYAPWLLCGLALAGANDSSLPGGSTRGIVTAEEVAAMNLANCELAVLSACETNVGARRAGTGIQSLQTALLAAGARTAITSLWKVSDEATRHFFETFYTKLWSDGLGKADALWATMVELREAGYPLADWAAWVLTGHPD